MAIASDRVDPELVRAPRRWDIGSIRRFMLVFGPLSSLFDLATFVLLLLFFHASPVRFRSAWFLESAASAPLVLLVVRTRRPFFASRPGTALFIAVVAVVVASVILPATPLGSTLGFCRLPAHITLAMALVVAVYVAAAEATKQALYRWADRRPPRAPDGNLVGTVAT